MTTASTTTRPTRRRRTVFEQAADLLEPIVSADCALMRRTPGMRVIIHEVDTIDYGVAASLGGDNQAFRDSLGRKLEEVALRRHSAPSALVDLRIRVVLAWTKKSTLKITVARLDGGPAPLAPVS